MGGASHGAKEDSLTGGRTKGECERTGGRDPSDRCVGYPKRMKRRNGPRRMEDHATSGLSKVRESKAAGQLRTDIREKSLEDVPSEGTANPLGTSCRLTSREEYPWA